MTEDRQKFSPFMKKCNNGKTATKQMERANKNKAVDSDRYYCIAFTLSSES